MNNRLSNWFLGLDYILIPLTIISILYQPNFFYGFIDHFEAGAKLACINEIFYGKLLYKDIFTFFGPLHIYLGVLFMSLFGKSLVVLRGYFYFGTIITLIIGYLIGRSLCYRRLFSYSIALVLIIETYHPFWATRWGGFRFGFGLLVILCAIQFFKQSRNLWALFAGIFVSVAFLTAANTGVLSLIAVGFTLSFYAAYNFLKNKTLDFKGILFFIIGILVILLSFILYYALSGMLLPYVNTLIVTVKNYLKVWQHASINLSLWESIKPSQIFKYNFKYIFPALLYGWSAIYLMRRIFKKTLCWKDYGILCLSVYGLLMYKLAFRAIRGPQFQIALQPAIILGFIYLEGIFEQIIKLKQKLVANRHLVKFVTLVIAFIFIVSYAVFSEKRFYGNLRGWFLYQKYKSWVMPVYMGAIPFPRLRLSTLTIERAKGIIVPTEQAEEIEGVTRYIISVTDPDEAVFAFPEHGSYNFFANRPCLDRFNIAAFAWTTPEYRQELLSDLKKMRPRYIIYSRVLSNLAKAIQRTEELLPEIIEYINSNYKKEISFGRTDILRRKE